MQLVTASAARRILTFYPAWARGQKEGCDHGSEVGKVTAGEMGKSQFL